MTRRIAPLRLFDRRFGALLGALFIVGLLVAPFAHAQTAAPKQPAAPKNDKATKDDYELDTSKTTTTLKVGGEGSFSLVIHPKAGKKVHPDAPLEVVFKVVPAAKPAKGKLSRSDVVDKAATAPELRTALRGVSKGSFNLEASVSFFICTDDWCQRMTDKVTVPVTVAD